MKKNYFNHNYKIDIQGFRDNYVAFLYRKVFGIWWTVRTYDDKYVNVIDTAQEWIDKYKIPSANISDLT